MVESWNSNKLPLHHLVNIFNSISITWHISISWHISFSLLIQNKNIKKMFNSKIDTVYLAENIEKLMPMTMKKFWPLKSNAVEPFVFNWRIKTFQRNNLLNIWNISVQHVSKDARITYFNSVILLIEKSPKGEENYLAFLWTAGHEMKIN